MKMNKKYQFKFDRYIPDEKWHQKRYKATLEFINKHVDRFEQITDLGIDNLLSKLIRNEGYKVKNTLEDLDINYPTHSDVFTAFEIFEHMYAPFNFLNNVKGKLICSVPLKKWFTKAHWNIEDPLDCHYHEFESKQFDALLKRTGWKIKEKKFIYITGFLEKYCILRYFYPEHYLVYAVKI